MSVQEEQERRSELLLKTLEDYSDSDLIIGVMIRCGLHMVWGDDDVNENVDLDGTSFPRSNQGRQS